MSEWKIRNNETQARKKIMSKQQQSVCVALTVTLPLGWEFVAFREPQSHEDFISGSRTFSTNPLDEDDIVTAARCLWVVDGKRVIVRRSFVWPDWVTPGAWYFKSSNGDEYLSEQEPHLVLGNFGSYWMSCLSHPWMRIQRSAIQFPVVPCDNWMQSKMRKPL